MLHVNVWLTVKDVADVAEVRSLLGEAGRLSRAEPGCLRFDVFHSEADPAKFLLHERWESREAWEVHRTGQAYTTIYQPKVLPRVNREPHISQLVE
jgi:quinol monooxygenase YgiN